MKTVRPLIVLLALSLSAGALAGCGNSEADRKVAVAEQKTERAQDRADAAEKRAEAAEAKLKADKKAEKAAATKAAEKKAATTTTVAKRPKRSDQDKKAEEARKARDDERAASDKQAAADRQAAADAKKAADVERADRQAEAATASNPAPSVIPLPVEFAEDRNNITLKERDIGQYVLTDASRERAVLDRSNWRVVAQCDTMVGNTLVVGVIKTGEFEAISAAGAGAPIANNQFKTVLDCPA